MSMCACVFLLSHFFSPVRSYLWVGPALIACLLSSFVGCGLDVDHAIPYQMSMSGGGGGGGGVAHPTKDQPASKETHTHTQHINHRTSDRSSFFHDNLFLELLF